MKNMEKYANIPDALCAYADEIDRRIKVGLDGLPFEDWANEDESTTERLVLEENERKEREEEAERQRAEAEAVALAIEQDAVRKGMVELKALYEENGFGEACEIIREVYSLDPRMDIYMDLASACNCMHSGMWSVWCDDFDGVWEYYTYIKTDGYCIHWGNTAEWLEQMKGLVEYIAPFVEEGKVYLENLKARANNR